MQGHYTNSVKVEWLPNGRDVRVLEPISFIDSNGKEWFVPAGTIVNGASIPRMLWASTGSPFVGKYRDASVIHDYFCGIKIETHEATHKMFHDAMLASGVDKEEANIKYIAVVTFGPKWDDEGNDIAILDLTPDV